jgi:hypothetical protein
MSTEEELEVDWCTKHYYMNKSNVIDRLVAEWTKYDSLIVAYDFDNTVYDYHKKGHNYQDVVNLLHQVKDQGAYLIVFTAAVDERINEVKQYLLDNNIPFDSINQNKPGLPFKDGGKIYYNILLDDRAGLYSAYYALGTALSIMKDGFDNTLTPAKEIYVEAVRNLPMAGINVTKGTTYYAKYYPKSASYIHFDNLNDKGFMVAHINQSNELIIENGFRLVI